METIKGSQPPETNIILRGHVSDDKLVCADWVVKAGGYMYVYAYRYIYIYINIYVYLFCGKTDEAKADKRSKQWKQLS